MVTIIDPEAALRLRRREPPKLAGSIELIRPGEFGSLGFKKCGVDLSN
jgi:hypothetical protein